MLDANLRLAPLAQERSQALAGAGVEPGSYLLLTLHREANVRPEPLARIAQALNEVDGADRLPGPSPHPRSAVRESHRARAAHSPRTTGRVHRLRRARVPGASRPDRLGGRPERGVLVRRPLCDSQDEHGVGRDRRERVEPPRRRRPRSDPLRRARGRATTCASAALRRRKASSSDRRPALYDGRAVTRELAIIGAGYVGLPLGQVFAEAGVPTVLVDVDERRGRHDQPGREPHRGRPRGGSSHARRGGYARRDDRLRRDARSGRRPDRCSHPAHSPARARPLDRSRSRTRARPATAAQGSSSRSSRRRIRARRGRSLRPILETSGLVAGKDFNLAFSPERVDPGRTDWTTQNTPKIVGGLTPACTERATGSTAARSKRSSPSPHPTPPSS